MDYIIGYRSGIDSIVSASSPEEAWAIECRNSGSESQLLPSWEGGDWDVCIVPVQDDASERFFEIKGDL